MGCCILQEQLLPDQDALINQEAMLGLKGLLELQPQLLDTLLHGPEYQQGDSNSPGKAATTHV